jgi:hypothetical protein
VVTNVLAHLLPLLDQFHGDHQHQLLDLALNQPPSPKPPPGGPDFSKITPDSSGVPKSGVMYTIAQVILFFGLGICFLVLLFGIITWVGGHIAGGMHLSQNAKTNMIRAGFGGIALTAAGGIWSWITAVS